MAWRLRSHKQAFFIQFLYSWGRAPRRGRPFSKSRAKRDWHSLAQPSLTSLSMGSSLPCILRPCQVDVSISGTSVDTSVGTASRWGAT